MRRRSVLLAACLLAALLPKLSSIGPAGATTTVTLVPDPERTSQSVVAQYVVHGLTTAQLSSYATSHSARIVDMEVETQTSNPLLTATLVADSGVFDRTWWFYVGASAAQVSSYLTSNSARLIDINPYTYAGQRKFAVVMVGNTGASQKSWWYYYDQTAAQLITQASNHGARLIDIAAYTVGSTRKYAGVMIANTGVDALGWWYSFHVTSASVGAALSSHSARLLDFERESDGYYDAIMVPASGFRWYYLFGQTASALSASVTQLGTRVISISTYGSGASQRFTSVLLSDLDANSEKVREKGEAAFTGGAFGFYVRKVSSTKRLGLNENAIYEPASSIKALHFVYELSRLQSGADSWSSPFYFWKHPDASYDGPGVCPDTANETNTYRVTTTLQTGMFGMMRDSDNRMTRGFAKRLGQTNLNNFAHSHSMGSTTLRQVIGCGFDNNLRNDLTLSNIGSLYNGVSAGTFLSGSTRDQFFALIASGGAWSGLSAIVTAEAHAVGKDAIASEFAKNIKWWAKGGSYDICGSGGCGVKPYTWIRTDAGLLDLPFKSAGNIVPTHYAFGRYGQLLVQCAQTSSSCSQKTKADAADTVLRDEIWRAQIKAALATW